MAEITNGSVMAEAVGVTSVAYLGGKSTLRSLSVEVAEEAQQAIVWVNLRESSIEAQLAAIEAFAEVRDCYEGELQIDLRFGEPSADRAATKARVYA